NSLPQTTSPLAPRRSRFPSKSSPSVLRKTADVQRPTAVLADMPRGSRFLLPCRTGIESPTNVPLTNAQYHAQRNKEESKPPPSRRPQEGFAATFAPRSRKRKPRRSRRLV